MTITEIVADDLGAQKSSKNPELFCDSEFSTSKVIVIGGRKAQGSTLKLSTHDGIPTPTHS